MIPTVLACAGVIIAFVAARRLGDLIGHPPLLSPVLVGAAIVAAAMALFHVEVARFETLTAPLRWALGPAIVALGATVHGARVALRARLAAALIAVAGGTIMGIAAAVGLARLFGLRGALVDALATKTLTTPFAVLIQTRLGGPVAVAAAFAVITGAIGAVIVPPLLGRLRLRGSATTGLAVGVSAQIIGTDWLSRRDAKAAAFSGAALVGAGVVASVVLPLVWPWLQRLAG